MAEPTIQKQFVSFSFYKISEEFRKLDKVERQKVKESFIKAAEEFRKDGILLSYSTVGFKAGTDLMLWLITYDLDSIQRMNGRLFQSALGPYLTQPASYLSMTKRSSYIDKHAHVGGTEESRTNILPGKFKYIFIYPFVKSREWYLLSKEERQRVMDEHIKVGNMYPSVKLNTTYSFGLDDQDFVVAFETDVPQDFLDLVMALRETEGSRYTLRDTPIFSCVHKSLKEALDTLGG